MMIKNLRKNRIWAGGLATATVTYITRESTQKVASCASLSTVATAQPTTLPLTVYQYKICPFCSKVKTYLDFMKIPYETIEVNPLTKSEISFSKDYKKVPILRIGGAVNPEQVNDSTAIVSYITNNLKATEKCGAKFLPADTAKWAEWSDEKLARLLYPNITRSFAESWECFEYVNHVKSWSGINQWVTRVAGTAAMSMANGKIKKKYNIVDERAELRAVLCEWTAAVGNKKFLHGNDITLPDLMVFGVLRAIDGLGTFKEIMEANKELKEWFGRVDAVVGSSCTASR